MPRPVWRWPYEGSGLTTPAFIGVLDANSGAVVRGNTFGDDGSVIDSLSLSLGDDGFRLLSGGFSGTSHFGSTVLRATPDSDISRDAFFLSLR